MSFPFAPLAEDPEFLSRDDGRSVSAAKGHSSCPLEPRWMGWRLISSLMGLFFFAAAFVQHNDPDPFLWVPAYVIPCLISWAVALGVTRRKDVKQNRPSSPPATMTNISMETHSKTRHPHSSTPAKENSGVKTGKEAAVRPRRPCGTLWLGKTKIDAIISIHILYCFALGLWTLWTFLGSRGTDKKVETATILGRTLKMSSSTEEAKELMGLCIVVAWLALLRNDNYAQLGKTGIFIGATLTAIPFLAWTLVEMLEVESKC